MCIHKCVYVVFFKPMVLMYKLMVCNVVYTYTHTHVYICIYVYRASKLYAYIEHTCVYIDTCTYV